MAAAAGLFSHSLTAGQALTGKTATPLSKPSAQTTGTGSSGSFSDASGDSATISANDFLTLLVTEMQNQDPTADTDPNEYINQLVQVNSLEQLIDINQTLSTDLGSTDSSSPTGQAVTAESGASGASPAGLTASPLTAAHSKGALSATPSAAAAGGTSASQASRVRLAPGNLSTPSADAAAQRVAHALNGRTRARPAASSVSALQ